MRSLTAETASSHTLAQLMDHFGASERGIKMALTKHGLGECSDFHYTGKTWVPKDVPLGPEHEAAHAKHEHHNFDDLSAALAVQHTMEELASKFGTSTLGMKHACTTHRITETKDMVHDVKKSVWHAKQQ